jgi:hypothetical protein
MARVQQDLDAIFSKYLSERKPVGVAPPAAHVHDGASTMNGSGNLQRKKPKKIVILIIIILIVGVVMFIIVKFMSSKKKHKQMQEQKQKKLREQQDVQIPLQPHHQEPQQHRQPPQQRPPTQQRPSAQQHPPQQQHPPHQQQQHPPHEQQQQRPPHQQQQQQQRPPHQQQQQQQRPPQQQQQQYKQGTSASKHQDQPQQQNLKQFQMPVNATYSPTNNTKVQTLHQPGMKHMVKSPGMPMFNVMRDDNAASHGVVAPDTRTRKLKEMLAAGQNSRADGPVLEEVLVEPVDQGLYPLDD